MPTLDFAVPFSGFTATNFINCFTSVYMYLENRTAQVQSATFCNEWENGQCNRCGHCATKPQALQERYFFLFDTMCGRSALRWRFDGTPTEMESWINGNGDDGDSEATVEFLFGFAGYRYHAVTDTAAFKAEIAASLDANRPIIARLKENRASFAVITGLDGDNISCPDFRCAQQSPDPSVSFAGIETLYIVDDKITPSYSLTDGLKRIAHVMDSNLRDKLWDSYMQKIGTYGPDSLGEDQPEGRKTRMKRLAATMWYTFNCHNFAEVFRTYLGERPTAYLYESVGDVSRLGDPALQEILNTISWRYGYTHDLAWSLIGLEECIDWHDWKSHYYGDMLEVVVDKLKENDQAVFDCIRELIRVLAE